MELIIYTAAADKTQAAVTSVSNTTPISSIEQLVLGDNPLITLKFTDGTSYQSWSGATGYTFRIALGNLDASATAAYTSTQTFADVTNGVAGRLSLSGQSLIDALALQVGSAVDWTRFPTQARVPFPRPQLGWFNLQVQVVDPSGNAVTYAQLRVPLLNRVLPPGAIPSLIAPTLYGLMSFPSVTGLVSTGLAPAKLGGITTAGGAMPVGSCSLLNFAVTVNDGAGTHSGTLTLLYQLQASSEVTAAPLWVRPYDYNNLSNPNVHRLLGAWLDTLPAYYNATTGKFHYLLLYGAANAVALYPDQIGTAAPA